MDLTAWPAFDRAAATAIAKHDAWAAAINSSGLVPLAFSKRVANPYGTLLNAPLAVDTIPLPARSAPCHLADAFLFIGESLYRDFIALK
jgi:hypothetical protein